jgi:hypothetical protein
MTKSLDDGTLNGIDKDFFKRILKQIIEKSYKFNSDRKVEIPKSGKSKLKSLGINFP